MVVAVTAKHLPEIAKVKRARKMESGAVTDGMKMLDVDIKRFARVSDTTMEPHRFVMVDAHHVKGVNACALDSGRVSPGFVTEEGVHIDAYLDLALAKELHAVLGEAIAKAEEGA